MFSVTKCSSFAGDLKQLCLDDQTNPVALGAALDDATAKEWRDWEPETISQFLKFPTDTREQKPVSLVPDDIDYGPIQQLDKIMAVQVALTNPDVFEDWPLFHHCNSAFNHRRCSFEWMEMSSYIELAWTCTVLKQLNYGHNFGPSIMRFITAACIHDGLFYFPWIGGEGLDVCAQSWCKGWTAQEEKIVETLKAAWKAGTFKELKPSDVDDKNVLHVQFAKIVNAQEYIRVQY